MRLGRAPEVCAIGRRMSLFARSRHIHLFATAHFAPRQAYFQAWTGFDLRPRTHRGNRGTLYRIARDASPSRKRRLFQGMNTVTKK